MFNRILVPLDGSTDGWVALEQTIEIARGENATIEALFVADSRIIEAPYWRAAPPDEPLPDTDPEKAEVALSIGQMIADYGDKVLTEARDRCQQADVSCETAYRTGAVVNEILDAATHVDLVVIGRYGQGAVWAGPNFGSVFEAVVRHAQSPVLATQAEVRPIDKILVAYDGSAQSIESLQVGVHFAQAQGRELVTLVINDGHPQMHEIFADLTEWLEDHNVTAKTLFEEGSPAETILRVEREENCSLIVMGAYGHSHFLHIFFGSTVDEVVHQAITPVLVCH